MAKDMGKQKSHEDNDLFAIKARKELFDFWKDHEDLDE